jgi:hypothetical protein
MECFYSTHKNYWKLITDFLFSFKKKINLNFTKGGKTPCEQQLLIELAINSGDFW